VTVALVLIPQSMAYAQLADLPAYYGLYAAFLPPIVAALFGSSRQLATRPVAVVSLMTATAGGAAFIQYAILLSLLVGLFQLALGFFRLGLVVNFISHPVVNRFTNAAALIIATSQLDKLFGVEAPKAEHQYETVYNTILALFNGGWLMMRCFRPPPNTRGFPATKFLTPSSASLRRLNDGLTKWSGGPRRRANRRRSSAPPTNLSFTPSPPAPTEALSKLAPRKSPPTASPSPFATTPWNPQRIPPTYLRTFLLHQR